MPNPQDRDTTNCTAVMTTNDDVHWGDLRLSIAAAATAGQKFEIDAELLLDLFDDAHTWADFESRLRSMPDPGAREIAVRGDGPYLLVMLDPYRGLTLTRADSMRGIIAEGSAVMGQPTWHFEIKRELSWDQLFTESNFGFGEWFGTGPQRDDPTASPAEQ